MLPGSTSRQCIADVDEDAEEEILAREYEDLQAVVKSFPPVQFQDEAAQPLGHGVLTLGALDFKALIDMRYAHQTCSADKGVRTRHSQREREGEKTTPTLCGSIIHQFHEALKEAQDDQAIGTGYERSARWTTNRVPAPGAHDGKIEGALAPALATGNSANAAVTAAAVVKQVRCLSFVVEYSRADPKQMATRRRNTFTKARVPHLREVLDALVSPFSPLKLDVYGFVFTDHGLRIGHGKSNVFKYATSSSIICYYAIVIAIYSKTGGKNGKHAAVTDASNISAVSYLAIQVFEHMHGRIFREHPDATATFQAKQFALLASNSFLCLLSSIPKTMSTGLELTQKDAEQFGKMLSEESKFMDAMRLFRKRGQTSYLDEDEE